MVCSLEESLRLEWNGDVDLDDGRLQKLYHSYRQRLDGLEHLTKLRSDIHLVLITLNREESDITTDLKFISECKWDLKFMLPHNFMYDCTLISIEECQ